MSRVPVTCSGDLITSVLGASTSLPTGPGGHGGNQMQQFTPTMCTGIAVMAARAVACLASGMALAARKKD